MILKWHNLAQLVALLCALIQAPLKPLLKVGDAPMIPLAKGFSVRRTESFHPSSVSHPEQCEHCRNITELEMSNFANGKLYGYLIFPEFLWSFA